jgi:hypothetical protein
MGARNGAGPTLSPCWCGKEGSSGEHAWSMTSRVCLAQKSSVRTAGRLHAPISVSNQHEHAYRRCRPRSTGQGPVTVTASAIPARASSASSPLRVLVSTGDVMGDIHAATLVQALSEEHSIEVSLPLKACTAQRECTPETKGVGWSGYRRASPRRQQPLSTTCCHVVYKAADAQKCHVRLGRWWR